MRRTPSPHPNMPRPRAKAACAFPFAIRAQRDTPFCASRLRQAQKKPGTMRAGPRVCCVAAMTTISLLAETAVHESNESVESSLLVRAVASNLDLGTSAEASSQDHHDGLGAHGGGALVDVTDGDVALVLLGLAHEDRSRTGMEAGSVDDRRLLGNHVAHSFSVDAPEAECLRCQTVDHTTQSARTFSQLYATDGAGG